MITKERIEEILINPSNLPRSMRVEEIGHIELNELCQLALIGLRTKEFRDFFDQITQEPSVYELNPAGKEALKDFDLKAGLTQKKVYDMESGITFPRGADIERALKAIETRGCHRRTNENDSSICCDEMNCTHVLQMWDVLAHELVLLPICEKCAETYRPPPNIGALFYRVKHPDR